MQITKSQKIYNYNCSRNEFFMNNIKMKRKKEDIEKLLLNDYLKDEIKKEVNLNNKNLRNSNSQHNLKTLYKMKNPLILKPNDQIISKITQQKYLNNPDIKNDHVNFKVLHNFIDDLHLNFNNTTTRGNDDIGLKENRESVDCFIQVPHKNSHKNNEINENIESKNPIIHEQHIKNMMSSSLYPETLSRSFELELFKKYLGKVKQERYKENLRIKNLSSNIYNNLKDKIEHHSIISFKKKNKEKIINLASKISSFDKKLNLQLGRFSNFYGKDYCLERFLIDKNLLEVYDHQDNILAYQNKKINNDFKPDKKIKLKPLIVKNPSSVERLANNMFRYTKNLSLIKKLNIDY